MGGFCLLITKTVQVRWSSSNKQHYVSRGYTYTKHNDVFECKTEDLIDGSHTKVEVMCDYCLSNGVETIVEKEWRRYIRDNVKSPIHTDCCAKCQPIKTKECNLINYGVESKTMLLETQEKMKIGCLKSFGTDHPMKNEEIRQRTVDTFIDRYGFDNPMKNQDIIDKSNATKILHFGSTNHMSSEEVVNKYNTTNLRKYGYEWHLQSPEIRAKGRKTMYELGSVQCSKQQRYLHNLFGGELNYPVSYLSLDIAFPENKIYIEYNGNGHDLSVKLGTMTDEKFKTREIKRYQYLKSQGWKVININSPYDYLPKDEVLREELSKAMAWLSEEGYGHSHYNIDIGLSIFDEKYGKLRRIKEAV